MPSPMYVQCPLHSCTCSSFQFVSPKNYANSTSFSPQPFDFASLKYYSLLLLLCLVTLLGGALDKWCIQAEEENGK